MQCPDCKGRVVGTNCSACGAVVSVADDTLDSMVQAGSVPNLAALFAKAKKSGALGAVSVYGEGA
jgi:hydroxyethylthiazole kinase-like sugar kinase family protein